MSKPSKYAEMIKAWGAGAVVQFRQVDSGRPVPNWHDCDGPGGESQPGWFEEDGFAYRIKPSRIFYVALVEQDSGIYLEHPTGSREDAKAEMDPSAVLEGVLRIEIDTETRTLVSATLEKP